MARLTSEATFVVWLSVRRGLEGNAMRVTGGVAALAAIVQVGGCAVTEPPSAAANAQCVRWHYDTYTFEQRHNGSAPVALETAIAHCGRRPADLTGDAFLQVVALKYNIPFVIDLKADAAIKGKRGRYITFTGTHIPVDTGWAQAMATTAK